MHFTSERISAKEGLLVGSSSGAAFHASLLEAESGARYKYCNDFS